MPRDSFNTTVAARTSMAEHLLNTSDLLARYQALGGLPEDLEQIRQAGLAAAAAKLAQSQARHEGKGLTLEALAAFSTLQKEYTAIMGVVQAVRGELARANASATLLAAVDGILRNEATVTVSTVEKQGAKKRRTRKSVSQEVVRAEVLKDTAALLALAEIHERLAARRVTVSRLEALREAAKSLTGAMAAQVVGQGAWKAATQAVRDAVTRQRAVWGATYRLFQTLARQDERVRSLLKEAAR